MPRTKEGQRILEFDLQGFGRAFRKVRMERKYRQQEVAEHIGIDQAIISRAEHAERYSPNAVIFMALWADINPTDFVKVNRKDPHHD